jgi:hypothetical protein
MRKGISTNAAGGDPELKTPGFCAALSDLSKSEFLCHIHASRVRGFHAWSPQGVKVDRGMRPCPCADSLESNIKASQVVWVALHRTIAIEGRIVGHDVLYTGKTT